VSRYIFYFFYLVVCKECRTDILCCLLLPDVVRIVLKDQDDSFKYMKRYKKNPEGILSGETREDTKVGRLKV